MPPRVLVTRREAQPLGRLLVSHGLQPVHVPLFRLGATGAPPPPGRPDLALVTSPAVAELEPRLASVLARTPIVAVGRKTAESLVALGLEVVAQAQGTGAHAVELLAPLTSDRTVVWHVGAVEVSPALEAALARWGHPVQRWTVYDNKEPEGLALALAQVLPVDAIVFTSGSGARNFAAHAAAGDARVVAIGGPTAEVCRELGLTVHAVAREPSMEALAEAAAEVLRAPPQPQ